MSGRGRGIDAALARRPKLLQFGKGTLERHTMARARDHRLDVTQR
jgi:hypothetical protein